MTVIIDGTNGIVTPTVQSEGVAVNLYPLVRGTSVTASGTSVDFTGIPSWVSRITVMFSGVSTSGTSLILVRLGTGVTPTYTASGYLGAATTSTGGTITNFSVGFIMSNSVTATGVLHGQAVLSNLNANIWVENGIFGMSDQTNTRMSGGSVTLAQPLTALRVTTVNGTDTFDAGNINILYE